MEERCPISDGALVSGLSCSVGTIKTLLTTCKCDKGREIIIKVKQIRDKIEEKEEYIKKIDDEIREARNEERELLKGMNLYTPRKGHE